MSVNVLQLQDEKTKTINFKHAQNPRQKKNVALRTYRKDVKFIVARVLAGNYIEMIA